MLTAHKFSIGLLAALLLSCVRASPTSSKAAVDYASFRWYAAPRDVPPLELKYHSSLDRLISGDLKQKSEEMLRRLCVDFHAEQSADYDKVRQVFCQTPSPKITSLRELEAALGLAIPDGIAPGRENNGKPGQTPGWAITAQSTSLVARFVSPINPRVILFTAPQDAKTPIPDFVVLGFVRGDQFAEVIAKEPKTGALKFFLIEFSQACNEGGACTAGQLQSSAVESQWTSVTVYEDSVLANTVFDCTHCHQPEGVLADKMLRMQEMERPWRHFFRDDTQGQELIQLFKSFHGPDEALGGIPAHLISSSDPDKLRMLLQANGFGNQPNGYDSDLISQELERDGAPGERWNKGWAAYLRGNVIPFPSWVNSILDLQKMNELKTAWDAAKASGHFENGPDLRLAVDDRLGPTYGVRAPQNASGKELLALACQRCHNQKLDRNLGKSIFQVDQGVSVITDLNAKNAISRLEILRDDPSNPLAMPPRLFMDLTRDEIELIIKELKTGRNL